MRLNKKISDLVSLEEEIRQRKSETFNEPSVLSNSVLDQSYTQVHDMKKREVKLQKVLESYEATFQQQAQELETYKTKIKALEEKEAFEELAQDLEIELEKLRNETEEKEEMNKFLLQQRDNRVSVAMLACDSANRLKDEAIKVKLETEAKLAEMTSKAMMAEEDCVVNLESVVRLTAKIKEYHKEQDEWKERFGRETEEKSKLEKKYKALAEKLQKISADNDRLAGHQNLKQKIQYISEMKKEYQMLKGENQRLVSEVQSLRHSETRKPLADKNADPRPVRI